MAGTWKKVIIGLLHLLHPISDFWLAHLQAGIFLVLKKEGVINSNLLDGTPACKYCTSSAEQFCRSSGATQSYSTLCLRQGKQILNGRGAPWVPCWSCGPSVSTHRYFQRWLTGRAPDVEFFDRCGQSVLAD